MSKSNVVLFIDDEIYILTALQRILRLEPYAILTAATAAEAMQALQYHAVAVVVADYRMGDIKGTQLLADIARAQPQIVGAILSGYCSAAEIQNARQSGAVFQ